MEAIRKVDGVVQQSDKRLSSLLEVASDWYWEQDENFRFTLLTGPALKKAGIDPQADLGKMQWGSGEVPLHDGGKWDQHLAVLNARHPFSDFIYKYVSSNGELHYISASGQPVFDQGGEFLGYRGIGRDVTQQVQWEMRRTIEHAVTRILAASDNIHVSIPRIIEIICNTLGWVGGAHWLLDQPYTMLRCVGMWGATTPAIAGLLTLDNRLIEVDKHPRDLVRHACDAGEAAWVRELQPEMPSTDSDEMAKAGLRSVLAFPIKTGSQVIGVIELISDKIDPLTTDLIECLNDVGDQISQLTQLIHAHEKLQQREERSRDLIELSSDWSWEQDEQYRTTYIDGRMEEKTGINPASQIGKRLWDSVVPNLTEEDWLNHKTLLERREPFYDLELRLPDLNDGQRWVSVSGRPMFDADGNFKGYRGIGKDVTARKGNEDRIRYLATHDALTSLPNRSMFSELLNRTIHSARRYNRKFAVAFIDLDRFKLINDTLGHDAGDTLLKVVSIRLTECLRTSDVVARLGGDEFVVMLQEVDEQMDAASAANKILSAVIKPVTLMGQECRVTCSVGICMFPAGGEDEQTLMKNADIAMYRAKEDGKNIYRFYSEDIKSQSLERMVLETGLRRAVELKQFFLHYQAQVDLKTRTIMGVEALVRWQHPELGEIQPLQFIPLAEETGLIVPIGRWVLREACMQNVAWQRQGVPPMSIAVNLSARQFVDESLIDDIANALQESGMDPKLLELELTESMVIQNSQLAGKLLTALKNIGVRIAIDDFGTGYSSLAQLKHFPIDTLKVDRSFIRDLPNNIEDRAITQAIINMGKTLSLTVVAEGVETMDQESFLRDNLCDEIQGFYFSKPISPEHFLELWNKQKKIP